MLSQLRFKNQPPTISFVTLVDQGISFADQGDETNCRRLVLKPHLTEIVGALDYI